MELIIVESPTKARTLTRFLGKDYSIEATMGHIKDLPKSKLGIDVDHKFKPDYTVLVKRAETIEKIIEKAKNKEAIYLATDPDREGEAIAAHVLEILNSNGKSSISKNKIKRIVFHEITKKAVEEAIKSPRGVDENLVNAQVARRVLDRLVGYKLSPLLWKKVRRGLSAGRVQSVAVRLIVEREREIESFKAQEYWEIFATVSPENSKNKKEEFIVYLLKINDKKAEVKNGKEAGDIVTDLKGSNYKISDIRKREVRKHPYPPFTTSTMTQAGARIFGWSAKKTMSIAQMLYEEGLITYHRTDSTFLSQEALSKGREFIEKEYGRDYLPELPRMYKTKSKVAQEAHEAIRPTDVFTTSSKVEITNKKFISEGNTLYDLIWRRFVASQMNDSVYDETRIDVLASALNGKDYILRATGQIMKFDGWRKLFPSVKTGEQILPELTGDLPLDLIKVESQQKFTQPPPRFNEASLIKTLEKLGIGRPSTYAPIITTIQIRQYVEKDEGKFTPTHIGIAVNDFLVTNFPDIFEYSFTAGMEDDLDRVANGEEKWQQMMQDFWTPFDKKLEKVSEHSKRVEIETEKLGKKCPKCEKGDLVVRIGRFGKFVSCSRFPDCDYKEKYIEKINVKCPDCKKGEVIIQTTKRGKRFYGCSRYPKCKWASWRKPETGNKKDTEAQDQ